MGRAERRHGQKKSKTVWYILALAVIIIGGLIYWNTGRGTGVDYTKYSYKDERFARPNATIVFEEFSDFQCPACQAEAPSVKAFRDSAPSSVVWRFRNFPLNSIHPLAQRAAEAAECARVQDRFWAYHDVLYESKLLDERSLRLHAEGLGLDVKAWRQCMDDGTGKVAVARDKLEGQQRGVQGTPSFFQNGQVFNGRSVSEFQAAIQG